MRNVSEEVLLSGRWTDAGRTNVASSECLNQPPLKSPFATSDSGSIIAYVQSTTSMRITYHTPCFLRAMVRQ